MFGTAGPAAHEIAVLGWVLTIISLAVLVVVSLILLAALFRQRAARAAQPDGVVIRPNGSITLIVWGGIVIPAIILVCALLFTLFVQSAVATPPAPPVATIRIVGHRWWWQVIYTANAPDQQVVTANEIHVPVGQPVRLELASADVIHSFWVPKLAGKTDVIPGQQNTMWMQADKPGVYWGECAEYCGLQHTHMNLLVVAQSPSDFRHWLDQQRQPPAPPTDLVTATGERVFERSACAACHTVAGTTAMGQMGPDLTHLASRRTLAAGTLANTPGNLAGWIANAQGIKPGNDMPTMTLPPGDLQALVAWLETLQ
jgi:cytochrome c oxidase subunit 2